MDTTSAPETLRFGDFEILVAPGELKRGGRRIKLQPQPFRLLLLLVRRAGTVVPREEIRKELWPEGTFVDFDQAVNFAIKQVRDVLGDHADRPVYVETVPRRGYRFIFPIETGGRGTSLDGTTVRLQKALWENIAELRLAEARRRQYLKIGLSALAAVILLALVLIALNARA
jgi:DNA-binding winged helix-turn-helix (wHTH) protein